MIKIPFLLFFDFSVSKVALPRQGNNLTRQHGSIAAVVEQSNTPELLPSPTENSNRHGNKNPVSASVTDAKPRRASRRLAGKQPEYVPTLSDIEAVEATSRPKQTWAIRVLAKHQPEHIPNPAREVTNELEPHRESRRLPRLVIKRVPASF
ncbi:hypothetical protein Acr_08g0009940 [Actinidia rufa]|uniref:Uncharacterized protein n=1 Tax=Actinidia rufa TaxID=165716 RepID=A0A7J0F1M6_9ERIC|nr:hypothetical protein Acr_08g0009940 [Actinidia rufa]